MRKTNNKSQDLVSKKVDFFWTEPDTPPMGSFNYDKDSAFAETEVLFLPELNETLAIELLVPHSYGFSILPTIVHGQVRKINPAGDNFKIYLKRSGRVGMSYYEMGACIGAEMVGYHQSLGRIEGKLKGLLPQKFELAIMEVPELNELFKLVCLKNAKEAGADKNELNEIIENNDNATVIIPWSCIWTKQGLEIMKTQRK